jgi:hypothetical protein
MKMKNMNKLTASNEAAVSPILSPKKSTQSNRKETKAIPASEHKQSFEQLLDDSILGVAKK